MRARTTGEPPRALLRNRGYVSVCVVRAISAGVMSGAGVGICLRARAFTHMHRRIHSLKCVQAGMASFLNEMLSLECVRMGACKCVCICVCMLARERAPLPMSGRLQLRASAH
eukprot:5909363-Pleurochrysis_carterae.AAC.1